MTSDMPALLCIMSSTLCNWCDYR